MRIFYSWQSNLPVESHKNYILECLKQSLNVINTEAEIEEADRPQAYVELDHDTLDVPGTPDIFSTILQKIDSSDLFLADLSFVGEAYDSSEKLPESEKKSRIKKLPNANVLIETGYALGTIGDDRILVALDRATATNKESPHEDLPFDLHHKRICLIFNSQASNKEEEKKRFINELITQIGTVAKVYGEREGQCDLERLPIFNDVMRSVLYSDSKTGWKRLYKEGVSTWYNTENVNLRFVLDYQNNLHCENFTEEWACGFPAPHAKSYYTELYFKSTLIDRFVLVSVDDSRALLPLPALPDLMVSPIQYQVAQIHDIHNTFQEYFHRARLRIVI